MIVVATHELVDLLQLPRAVARMGEAELLLAGHQESVSTQHVLQPLQFLGL